MAIFRIKGTITSSNQAELLASMDWFATNYGSKMVGVDASGENLELKFGMDEDNYANMLAAITAIQSQFTTRLTSAWRVSYIS